MSDQDLRYCNCADPENCSQPVVGYVCRRMYRSAGAQQPCPSCAEAELMKADLYRIGEALGIGARQYSGHEAVTRDFLPRIAALKREVCE